MAKFKKGDRVRYSRRYINQFVDSAYKSVLKFYRGKVLNVKPDQIDTLMQYDGSFCRAEYTKWALKRID